MLNTHRSRFFNQGDSVLPPHRLLFSLLTIYRIVLIVAIDFDQDGVPDLHCIIQLHLGVSLGDGGAVSGRIPLRHYRRAHGVS